MSDIQYVGKHMDLENVVEIRNVGAMTLNAAATDNKHPIRKAEFDVQVQALNAEADAKLVEAKSYADTKITALVDGADAALDTLKELGDRLEADKTLQDAISDMASANAAKIAQKVSEEVKTDITFTNTSGVYTAEVAHGFNTSHVRARLQFLDNLEWFDLDDDGVTISYTDTKVKLRTLSPSIGAMTVAVITAGVPVAQA